jgi:hypothetical protein
MENRRQDLLNQLEAATKKPVRTDDDLVSLNHEFHSLGFQILYGLPEELQFRAAFHSCERYLPIFEKKQPGSTWVRQLLGDIDAWHRAEGDATPDGPDESDSADTHYHCGFTDLLVGYRYRDHPACLTAGVCGMIIHVVWARAGNVFLADDAIAARIEQEEDAFRRMKDAYYLTEDGTYRDEEEDGPREPKYFHDLLKPEHSAFDNVAFQAVYCRECLHVVEWLRAEEVWKYPEPNDLDAMRHGLKRWEECECTFLTPTYVERGNTLDDTPE